MGLLAIFIGLAVILIVLELFKHHFTKNLFKWLVYSVIFIFILLMLSAYIDLGSFFAQDNTFAKTGQVIADDVQDDIKDIDIDEIDTLDTIEERIKNWIRNTLDN
tara:strand:+ start:4418 stop:4732 length:315 start_codon:yes stop_codon:yes gene_type:complete